MRDFVLCEVYAEAKETVLVIELVLCKLQTEAKETFEHQAHNIMYNDDDDTVERQLSKLIGTSDSSDNR